MAQLKYGKMPEIDRSAPDVYETEDLPEVDQSQFDEDEGNDCVEEIKVSSDELFKKFRGKKLDSGNIDFSDRVSRSSRHGYIIPFDEYVSGIEKEVETPKQKFQRLQLEIHELAENLDKIEKGVSSVDNKTDNSSINLVKQVEYLQHQLTDLHVDKIVGLDATFMTGDPQGALQNRLLTELDAYQSKVATSKDDSNKEALQSVTYQLYYKPEQAKFSNNARLADVEQRIERLEATIGNNVGDKISPLCGDTANKSIVSAVALLSSKVKLLDPVQIDQVEARMHNVSTKLSQLNEKKESIDNSEKSLKLAELFELTKKWDSVVDMLPNVCDRLVSLQCLHEQAIHFSQALTHLDTAQQQMSSLLKAHDDMAKQTDNTLKANMDIVKANVESIEKRLSAL